MSHPTISATVQQAESWDDAAIVRVTNQEGEEITYRISFTRSEKVALDAVEWVSATNGWKTIQKNTDIDGDPIEMYLDGQRQTLEQGLGVHATSEIVYEIGGRGYDILELTAGLTKGAMYSYESGAGHLRFHIFVDGVEVAGQEMRAYTDHMDDAVTLRLNVIGANEIRLYVEDLGSDSHDHFAWANAYFSTRSETDLEEIQLQGLPERIVLRPDETYHLNIQTSPAEIRLVYALAQDEEIAAIQGETLTGLRPGTAELIVYAAGEGCQTVNRSIPVLVSDMALEIESVEDAHLAIPSGGTPQLPAGVVVHYTNGTWDESTVRWSDPEENAFDEPGQVVLKGTVEGTNLQPNCVISVGEGAAVSWAETIYLSAERGTEVVLPEEVTVILANGSTSKMPAVWPEEMPQERGNYRILGTVQGTEVPVACELTIYTGVEKIVLSYSTAIAVTTAGILPELPGQVEAIYHDGTSAMLNVIWTALDEESYSQPGTVTVYGYVPGYSPVAQCTVTVNEASGHIHALTFVSANAPTCTEAGNIQYWYCEGCKGCFLDEQATQPISQAQTVLAPLGHSGGEATCVKKAVCEVCGAEYGETNPNNHKHVELIGYRPATAAQAGYTGDCVCQDCGTVITKGKEIPKLSGGNIHPVKPVDPVQPTEPDTTFVDVQVGSWYEEAVSYVAEAGLMTGVGNGKFNPDGSVTRAMVWTVLARMAGENTDGGATWYSKAQSWVMRYGVSDGTNPMDSITREQLAAMLYRYEGSPKVSGNLNAYPDANTVSDWAKEALVWATQEGIINGMGGKLSPKTGATRAQLATMLMRLREAL